MLQLLHFAILVGLHDPKDYGIMCNGLMLRSILHTACLSDWFLSKKQFSDGCLQSCSKQMTQNLVGSHEDKRKVELQTDPNPLEEKKGGTILLSASL